MTKAPRRPALALRDMDDAAAAVRAAGGRLTAPRRAVLQALFDAGDLVSAEEIADGLGGRGPKTDPASVYRNLEWLEEIGIARHVHVGHGAGVYSLAGAAGHEHLVCERCGRVTRVEAGTLARARAEITRTTGYRPHFDHFPIHGTCPDCAADQDGGA
jgi:Fur family ferric uptake transcriptional regulator